MNDPRHVATRNLLARFVPPDPAVAEARRAMLDLLATTRARAFERTSFEPGHLTASALVLPPGGGAVLLVHHARLGLWLQPGGHVEARDPDLLASALRELEEETGIRALVPADPLLDLDVHRIPARPGEPAHLHFDVRFLLAAPTWEVHAGDGVRAVRWVALADLPAAGTDASVLRAAARIAGRGSDAFRAE
jgi:8-oxo-dGTP pyrophosphatase MutT (NUDIX family)